jgi:hypothetical protein
VNKQTLVDECKRLELPYSGTKLELRDRIQLHLSKSPKDVCWLFVVVVVVCYLLFVDLIDVGFENDGTLARIDCRWHER